MNIGTLLTRHARTVCDHWNAIGIKTFTPTECQNYAASAGYERV